MKLTVNGETTEYAGEPTLAGLILHRGGDPDRLATMLNDEVVLRMNRNSIRLNPDDHVEILSFAGGG